MTDVGALTEKDETFLKSVAVRLRTSTTEDQETRGSGVLFLTPKGSDKHYVFTALHCLRGERGDEGSYPHRLEEITEIDLEFVWSGGADEPSFHHAVPKSDVEASVISDESRDVAIVLVPRSSIDLDPSGHPSYQLAWKRVPDGSLHVMGFPKFKSFKLFRFSFLRGPVDPRRVTLEFQQNLAVADAAGAISGLSGAGLFPVGKQRLVGVLSRVATNSEGEIVAGFAEATTLETRWVNRKLRDHSRNLWLFPHEGKSRFDVREDSSDIDYERVLVDGLELDLWKAVHRVRADMADDWFGDPCDFPELMHAGFVNQVMESAAHRPGPSYQASAAATSLVPKKGFTARVAVITNLVDRVIYQALIDLIAEDLDGELLPRVYSFRCNTDRRRRSKSFFVYSIDQWKKFQWQIYESLNEDAPYLLCADLSNYFDHIDVEDLKQQLLELASDAAKRAGSRKREELEKAIDMLVGWLRALRTSDRGIGIPQNRDASSFLGNVMLHAVDLHMTNGCEFDYYRYLDDIMVVCRSRAEAQRAIMALTRALRRHGFSLNAAKTCILHRTDDKAQISRFLPQSDIEIEQIDNLVKSGGARAIQIAVTMTLKLLKKLVSEEETEDEMRTRKFAFCIQRLSRFARQEFLASLIPWSEVIQLLLPELHKQPWCTRPIINLLSSVDAGVLTDDCYAELRGLVSPSDEVIYDWQAYHVWRLFALRRHSHDDLTKTAHGLIRNPKEDQMVEMAGACLYLAANAHEKSWRSMADALNGGRFKGPLAQSAAVVALRAVPHEKIEWERLEDPMLEQVHRALDKSGDDGVVDYVLGPEPLAAQDVLRDLPAVISSGM